MDDEATGGRPGDEPEEPRSPSSPGPAEADASRPAVDALGHPPPTVTRVARMRPVPEEFPTPPPRPAGWNRRRAAETPAAATRHPRRGMITVAIVVISILALLVVLGGGFLLVCALGPGSGGTPGAAPSAESPGGESAAPELDLGGARITTLSFEDGIEEVGPQGRSLEAEGTFAILTVTVQNDSESSITLDEAVTLIDAEGNSYTPDYRAGIEHTAASDGRFRFINPGDDAEVHIVFDLPEGAAPDHARIDLSMYPELGSGDLSLT